MHKHWDIGAWAAEAELAEEEEKAAAAAAASAAASASASDAFPSLEDAARNRSQKKKKHTLSLAEFTIGQSVAPGSRSRFMSDSRGLTSEEMTMLPTRPRDRSSEDDRRDGLGGAFRDYTDRFDRERYPSTREREAVGSLKDRERNEPSRADDSSNWGSLKKSVTISGAGYENERRPRMPEREPPPPSRADEVDNWGSVKKSQPFAGSADARPAITRQTAGESSGLHSRADEVQNWSSTKKSARPLSVEAPKRDFVAHVQSPADDAQNWLSSKVSAPSVGSRGVTVQQNTADSDGRWLRRPAVIEDDSQRKPLVLALANQNPTDANDSNLKPNPFGSARPRELVLAERQQDDSNVLVTKESGERPPSSNSRWPSSSTSRRPLTPEISTRINPFGNAKPREVLLEARGKDWRKMDFELEHKGVDRQETEEEILLKEQIETLRKQAELSSQDLNSIDGSIGIEGENRMSISRELQEKEKELEELVRALDDKVRFSQKVLNRKHAVPERAGSLSGSRPGSRSGSRPGSQSGRSESGRNYDVLESQSGRGTPDSTDMRFGYGMGRAPEPPGEKLWSRSIPFEGSKSQESFENSLSFVSLQRSAQRPQRGSGILPIEAGSNSLGYRQEQVTDIWTRSNDGAHGRKGSWGNDRTGTGRF